MEFAIIKLWKLEKSTSQKQSHGIGKCTYLYFMKYIQLYCYGWWIGKAGGMFY